VVEPEGLEAGWWAPPQSLKGEALPTLFRKVLAEAGFS
jgi:A/G-specific adenine glycosylase